jgi:hypothetical protein
MKLHPEKEGEVYTVIGTLPPAVQAYLRRMLDSRKTADNPCKLLPSLITEQADNQPHAQRPHRSNPLLLDLLPFPLFLW